MLKRRWVRNAAALLVLVALTGVAVVAWPGPARATQTPTLPAEFAAFSPLTAHAEDRPAGRAIAFFETGSWEMFTSYQAIVVGADRDSYRQLSGGAGNSTEDRPILLSPDGTHVIYRRPGGGPDEFDLLDLSTGTTTRRHGVAWTPGQSTAFETELEHDALLAWSPDGRYVAYTVHADFVAGPQASPYRQLAILDLDADRAVLYPAIEGVYTAAFAPDSRRLALATDSGGIFMSVDGTRTGTWTDPSDTVSSDVTWESEGQPSGQGLPAGFFGLAWSPDGSTLAVATGRFCGPEAMLTGGGPTMTVTAFVDTTDGTPLTPHAALACLRPLGWRSSTTLIGEQIRPDHGYGLAEVSLVDGSVTPISHFSYAPTCEIGGQCDVWRIQLATNLLGTVGVRDSLYPDRGPTVAIAYLGPALALVAGLVWVLVPVIARRVRRPRESTVELGHE